MKHLSRIRKCDKILRLRETWNKSFPTFTRNCVICQSNVFVLRSIKSRLNSRYCSIFSRLILNSTTLQLNSPQCEYLSTRDYLLTSSKRVPPRQLSWINTMIGNTACRFYQIKLVDAFVFFILFKTIILSYILYKSLNLSSLLFNDKKKKKNRFYYCNGIAIYISMYTVLRISNVNVRVTRTRV